MRWGQNAAQKVAPRDYLKYLVGTVVTRGRGGARGCGCMKHAAVTWQSQHETCGCHMAVSEIHRQNENCSG